MFRRSYLAEPQLLRAADDNATRNPPQEQGPAELGT